VVYKKHKWHQKTS